MEKKYYEIVKHYEDCLDKHGDNHKGVDWPNQDDLEKRYRVMLDVVRFSNFSNEKESVQLLDFGCGASHLYDFIMKNGMSNIHYSGLDLSEKFIQLCRNKYPHNRYYCLDILQDKHVLPEYDFIVMNGVFTEKRGLQYEEMLAYFQEMIKKIAAICKIGFAFNVMSKQVDWERDDLFHLSMDKLSEFLCKEVTRDFIIRNDYGLYEYTTYVFPKK